MAVRDSVLAIDVGRKNLALCVVQPGEDPHGRQDTIHHWLVMSVQPTADGVADALRSAGVLAWLDRVREVVIERQVSRNCGMMRIQNYLEMLFALQDRRVTLQDSRLKLNFAAATQFWSHGVPDKWTYYTRKKVAVNTVARFLEQVPQSEAIRATFERSAKKDDLADSLLHGLAFAHFHCTPQPLGQAKLPAPRRPSARQLASGKLSKSHVRHLAAAHLDSVDTLFAACEACKPLGRAVSRHFGSVEMCHKVLTAAAAESRVQPSEAHLGPPLGASATLAPGPPGAQADEEARGRLEH